MTASSGNGVDGAASLAWSSLQGVLQVRSVDAAWTPELQTLAHLWCPREAAGRGPAVRVQAACNRDIRQGVLLRLPHRVARRNPQTHDAHHLGHDVQSSDAQVPDLHVQDPT